MDIPNLHLLTKNASGLGRVPSTIFDHGKRYTLPERRVESQTRRRRHWVVPQPRIDQLSTSECVIYTGDNLLRAQPIMNKGFLTPGHRTYIYKEVQRLDQWPGEEYDGTSILALMRWLKEHRLVESYGWGRNVDAVVNHLLNVSPLAMGTTWTIEMFMPDQWGYIRFTGPEAGGHAWTLVGADLDRRDPLTGKRGAVRLLNSWGPNWGDMGRAWVTFDDLQKLLDDWGEAATPIELKVK